MLNYKNTLKCQCFFILGIIQEVESDDDFSGSSSDDFIPDEIDKEVKNHNFTLCLKTVLPDL